MAKLLSVLVPFLVVGSAYAQTTADSPADKESILPVVIFLLLFVGSCVAYFAYLWWNERKKRRQEIEDKSH